MSSADHYHQIDKGIEIVENLKIPQKVFSINLHSNQLLKISPLFQTFTSLRVLNLSTNRISTIENLFTLKLLHTLNLSGNFLKNTNGLAGLVNLENLNLSYNLISNLHGLKELSATKNELRNVELQSNEIFSLQHVSDCFAAFSNLRKVYFSRDSDYNPICEKLGYRKHILMTLPKLDVLDGINRKGELCEGPSRADDLHVLNEVDMIQKDDVSTQPVVEEVKQPNPKSIPIVKTPHVDALLSKLRSNLPCEDSEDFVSECGDERNADFLDMKNKITQLECQIELLIRELHKRKEVEDQVPVRDTPKPVEPVQTPDPDAQNRQKAGAIFSKLVNDLNTEKNRRLKAEQCVHQLSERFASFGALQKETALLKDQIVAETKERERYKAESDSLVEEFKKRLELAENSAVNYRDEADKWKNEVEEVRQDYQAKFAVILEKLQATQRALTTKTEQLEICRSDLETTRQRMSRVEEAAKREKQRQQRDTIEEEPSKNGIFIPRVELEALVTKAANETCQRQYAQKAYEGLEKEFRFALHTEAERFRKVAEANQTLSQQNEKMKTDLDTTCVEMQRQRRMIEELSSLAKEQKVKLQCQAEQSGKSVVTLRETLTRLQNRLCESEKKAGQLEAMRKERVKLLSQVQALESVVEGLKKEKHLWCNELASQGVSLSADRGRLDVQIETLKSECNTLKTQLEGESDTVRIKAKIIEDQVSTIKELKAGLAEKDGVVKKLQAEVLDAVKAKEEIAKTVGEELEIALEKTKSLEERKESLKDELFALQSRYELEKKTNRDTKKDLQARKESVEDLEFKLTQLGEEWRKKEGELRGTNEKLTKDNASLSEKLHSIDTSFRGQLDVLRTHHDFEKTRITKEHKLQIDRYKFKIEQVENEMRQILIENRRVKDAWRASMTHLGQAFEVPAQKVVKVDPSPRSRRKDFGRPVIQPPQHSSSPAKENEQKQDFSKTLESTLDDRLSSRSWNESEEQYRL